MSTLLRLADPAAAADLETYLGRAAEVLDGAARLVVGGGILAVYVPILHPAGLLDDAATVLGLRTVALSDQELEIDEVVPIASLRARLSSAADGEFGLPMAVYSVTWAGVAPPRSGWVRKPEPAPASLLRSVAEEGIREVADALPVEPGEAVVKQVRQSVWNESIPGHESLPRGAAFAAVALGFVRTDDGEGTSGEDDEVGAVFEVGPWTRLTLRRGHVLVKRHAWSMAR